MRLLISKYELKKLILEEHYFNEGTLHYYTSDNNCVVLPKCTLPSFNIRFYINKYFILFELTFF
jgi:hypothetical protein